MGLCICCPQWAVGIRLLTTLCLVAANVNRQAIIKYCAIVRPYGEEFNLVYHIIDCTFICFQYIINFFYCLISSSLISLQRWFTFILNSTDLIGSIDMVDLTYFCQRMGLSWFERKIICLLSSSLVSLNHRSV